MAEKKNKVKKASDADKPKPALPGFLWVGDQPEIPEG